MRVLALDLGQQMGWVLGGAVGPVRHGVISTPATTDLRKYLAPLASDMRRLVRHADRVAVEKPFTNGGAYYAIRKNMASLAMLYYVAGFEDIPVEEVSVATGKLTLSGRGNADKDMMIAAAARLGFPGMCEHEADALGIWWVAVHGRAEPAPKRRTRSSKGVSLMNGEP